MAIEGEQLQAIRAALADHRIRQAWVLDSDPTELVVMLDRDDWNDVDVVELENELRSLLIPHRKVWVAELQRGVTVHGRSWELPLRPVFASSR